MSKSPNEINEEIGREITGCVGCCLMGFCFLCFMVGAVVLMRGAFHEVLRMLR